MEPEPTFTAFEGDKLIVTANLEATVRKTKARLDAGAYETVLVFEDQTGNQVGFDFRGTIEDGYRAIGFAPALCATGERGQSADGSRPPEARRAFARGVTLATSLGLA